MTDLIEPGDEIDDAMPIDEFITNSCVSVRLGNCLTNAREIVIVGDVRAVGDWYFLRQPNLGRISLRELRSYVPFGKHPASVGAPSAWEVICGHGRISEKMAAYLDAERERRRYWAHPDVEAMA